MYCCGFHETTGLSCMQRACPCTLVLRTHWLLIVHLPAGYHDTVEGSRATRGRGQKKPCVYQLYYLHVTKAFIMLLVQPVAIHAWGTKSGL